jgi:hypothetical protein
MAAETEAFRSESAHFMKVIKILLTVVGVFVALIVVAIVAAGALSPAERSFTNEIAISAPAEKVWQVITDKARYTEWQTT